MGAAVAEDRVEGDGSDRDHQVRLDQLQRQVHPLTCRRRGQVLSPLGLLRIVDPPRNPLADLLGQVATRVGWFGRAVATRLKHEYVFGVHLAIGQHIPDRREDRVGSGGVEIQGDDDLVAGDHGLLQRREVERSGQCVADRGFERFDLLGRFAASDQAVGIDGQRQVTLAAVSHVDGMGLWIGHGSRRSLRLVAAAITSCRLPSDRPIRARHVSGRLPSVTRTSRSRCVPPPARCLAYG